MARGRKVRLTGAEVDQLAPWERSLAASAVTAMVAEISIRPMRSAKMLVAVGMSTILADSSGSSKGRFSVQIPSGTWLQIGLQTAGPSTTLRSGRDDKVDGDGVTQTAAIS